MLHRSGLLLLLAAGCSSAGVESVVLHPDAPPIAPFEECTVIIAREPSLGRDHVAPCTPLVPASMPPTSGTHYGLWADFGVYDAPVPWGYLVHSMEHGAVVVAYRCDDAACALRDELEALVAAQPADPLCRDDDPTRFILAPAPDLEWPIALLAWERQYVATCLDLPSMQDFIDQSYARAPENLCVPGIDDSARGWCPG